MINKRIHLPSELTSRGIKHDETRSFIREKLRGKFLDQCAHRSAILVQLMVESLASLYCASQLGGDTQQGQDRFLSLPAVRPSSSSRSDLVEPSSESRSSLRDLLAFPHRPCRASPSEPGRVQDAARDNQRQTAGQQRSSGTKLI